MDTKNSVLVVDDEQEICKMLKKFFEKKWYEVSYVLTGREAIEKVKKRKFNVALLDINLPDIDGTALIPILKKLHPGIKIVMITGDATRDNTIRALNNGASYYFEKPFKIEELLKKTNDLIEEQNEISFQKVLEESAKLDIAKPGRLLPFKIRRAIEYIENNYTNSNLCLNEIASAVSMRPNSFSSLWRETMEMETANFINGIRVEKAKSLLLESSFYISQVAYMVGLTPDYFCKVFKSKAGVSPVSYRKTKLSVYPAEPDGNS
jgi:two-component system, response regulator YesN